MPPTNPTNTPNQSSHRRSPLAENPAQRRQTPPSYLTALREIESPVVDLAATLTTATTAAEEEADADNVSFLRTPIDPQDEWRAQNAAAEEELFEEVRSARQRVQALAAEMRQEDRNRRERLQRILGRLSRLQDPAYGDRVPSQNSLYDWAPASEEENEDDELRGLVREIRDQRPEELSGTSRATGRSQQDANSESRNRPHSSRFLNTNQPSQSSESSLRSAAILQSVRRHPMFSARSRDYMQRYMMDRERSGLENEDRERYNPSRLMRMGLNAADNRSNRHATDRDRLNFDEERDRLNLARVPARGAFNALEASRYELNRLAWQNQQRSSDSQGSLQRDSRLRVDAYRRGYLENPSAANPPAISWLQQTVQYLANLRSCASYEESLSHAVDGGFVTKDFFAEGHEDFIMDIGALLSPPETSWLAPGAVFSGSQHATNLCHGVTANSNFNTLVPPTQHESSISSNAFEPSLPPTDYSLNWPWLGASSHLPPHLRTSNTVPSTRMPPPLQDRWPVKVTIHAVDYDTMTLSATMEAYNVPSHPPSMIPNPSTSNSSTPTASTAPSSQTNVANPASVSGQPPYIRPHATKTSSITTFLEGEILDFTTHTLLTESYTSTPATDAMYWRKLEPFRDLSDDELVRRLVSRAAMEELRREWILMRWKERCFVRRKRRRGGSAFSNTPTGTTTANTHTSTAGAAAAPNSLGSGTPATGPHGPGEDKDVHMGADDDDSCSDDGCGLTISGFYYVCLRRSTGVIEGLYCDPQSSPYQHLRLAPVGGGTRMFPCWDFR